MITRKQAYQQLSVDLTKLRPYENKIGSKEKKETKDGGEAKTVTVEEVKLSDALVAFQELTELLGREPERNEHLTAEVKGDDDKAMEEPPEIKKITALRRQLIRVREASGFSEEIDKLVFDIQITLTKAFPNNRKDNNGFYEDPVSYESIEDLSPLNVVAFSSGELVTRKQLRKFYKSEVTSFSQGRPRHITGGRLLDQRELDSLRSQDFDPFNPFPRLLDIEKTAVNYHLADPEEIVERTGYARKGYVLGRVLSPVVNLIFWLLMVYFYMNKGIFRMSLIGGFTVGFLAPLVGRRRDSYFVETVFATGFSLIVFFSSLMFLSALSPASLLNVPGFIFTEFPGLIEYATETISGLILMGGAIQSWRKQRTIADLFEQGIYFILNLPLDIASNIGESIGKRLDNRAHRHEQRRQAPIQAVRSSPSVTYSALRVSPAAVFHTTVSQDVVVSSSPASPSTTITVIDNRIEEGVVTRRPTLTRRASRSPTDG